MKHARDSESNPSNSNAPSLTSLAADATRNMVHSSCNPSVRSFWSKELPTTQDPWTTNDTRLVSDFEKVTPVGSIDSGTLWGNVLPPSDVSAHTGAFVDHPPVLPDGLSFPDAPVSVSQARNHSTPHYNDPMPSTSGPDDFIWDDELFSLWTTTGLDSR
jgi:hypothetical protein